MSEDPRPTRWCENKGCSLNEIKVKTRAELCVQCAKPLRDEADSGKGIGSIFDDLFGPLRKPF